VKRSVSYV